MKSGCLRRWLNQSSFRSNTMQTANLSQRPKTGLNIAMHMSKTILAGLVVRYKSTMIALQQDITMRVSIPANSNAKYLFKEALAWAFSNIQIPLLKFGPLNIGLLNGETNPVVLNLVFEYRFHHCARRCAELLEAKASQFSDGNFLHLTPPLMYAYDGSRNWKGWADARFGSRQGMLRAIIMAYWPIRDTKSSVRCSIANIASSGGVFKDERRIVDLMV